MKALIRLIFDANVSPTCYQYATNESFFTQSKTTCTKKEPPFTDGFLSAFKRYSCSISIDSDCSSSSSSKKSSTPILCALMVMLLPIMLPIIFVQLALSRFYHKNNIYQPRTRVRDVKWQKYRYVDETKRALSRKRYSIKAHVFGPHFASHSDCLSTNLSY